MANTKKVGSTRLSPELLSEYEKQVANYERDLAKWQVKRIKFLFLLIGFFDLLVGLAVALLAIALNELGSSAAAGFSEPLLLAGLIMTVAFIVCSLVASALLAFWKRTITDVPKIAGIISFLGLFGGLTIVNTVLCAIAWFQMGAIEKAAGAAASKKTRAGK